MKKNTIIFGLFICLAVFQAGTPLSMIIRRELTLRKGTQYRFRVAPVDPYDAFRGRYVSLRIDQNKVPILPGTKFKSGQRICVLLGKDEQGFASLSKISLDRPGGNDYLNVRVKYTSRGNVYLDLPFSRYYMEEKAAPRAERAFRNIRRGQAKSAYITARVRNGSVAIENLFIEGKPVSLVVKDLR